MSVEVQSSFKDQFSLVKTSDKDTGFYNNKYSYLNQETAYVEPVKPENMFPFNTFETLKNSGDPNKFNTRSRDGTLIIKDYHSNEVGQYARPKKEVNYMFKPMKNDNALAGDTKIVDKIGLDRFSSALKYKNGDLLDNTNIRPEWIDGVPTTFMIRPREKTQEELRGKGVNSQRLAPENRPNQTGMIGEGMSVDPEEINGTRVPMLRYREQNSVDDLLRTTGAITKPEWRSLVRKTDSERSYMKSIDGPPMASVAREEFRNEQAARPTQKEDENNFMGPSYSYVNNTEYRNYQAANPTHREDYIDEQQLTGTVSYVGKEEFRNYQSANPTMRTSYEGMLPITGVNSFVPKEEFRNYQSANPTLRTDYEGMLPITGINSFVPKDEFRNYQAANPTIRTDYEGMLPITNTHSYVPKEEYRNYQSANPTIRTDYEGMLPITNTHSYVPKEEYRNYQAANPTIRTDYEGMLPITNTHSYVPKEEFRNYQAANPTIRTEYEGLNPITGTTSFVPKDEFRNNQAALPTNREELYNGVSGTYNMSGGMVYENMQPANPTNRMDYEGTKYINGSFNQSSGQYRPYNDITRAGMVEDVMARDYKGGAFSFVGRETSHTASNNMVLNDAVENSINLTNRELGGGGTDRIPQGRENIGLYSDRNRREKMGTLEGGGKVRNVAVNYIGEVPNTRGYNLLQERSPINQHVPTSLNMNPFVNNIIYTGPSTVDVIRETTNIGDRLLDRK